MLGIGKNFLILNLVIQHLSALIELTILLTLLSQKVDLNQLGNYFFQPKFHENCFEKN